MIGRDEVDRPIAEHRARMRRQAIANMIVGWAVLALAGAAVAWGLMHPREIGTFLGTIAAAFRGAAH